MINCVIRFTNTKMRFGIIMMPLSTEHNYKKVITVEPPVSDHSGCHESLDHV